MWSRALHARRTVLIYLPAGYFHGAARGRRYPVLYLLHPSMGQVGNYVYAGALFPREGFERVGRLSGECWGSDDYDLWLRLMEEGYEVVTTRESPTAWRLIGVP